MSDSPTNVTLVEAQSAWTTSRRAVIGLLLAILSGVIAALSAPPFPLWPLIFVAQHRVLPAR